MSTIQLKINRIGSFMSRHIPYDIWFRNQKMGRILKDADCEFTIKSEKGVLKIRELGSKFAFHTIEKSVLILPENLKSGSNKITVDVEATINWLGALTCGLLAPIRRIHIKVVY